MYPEENEDQLPTTTIELVEWLDKAYPDTITTRELSAYEQGLKNGVIDLIRILKYKLEEKEL